MKKKLTFDFLGSGWIACYYKNLKTALSLNNVFELLACIIYTRIYRSTPPADYHSNLPSITPDSLEVEGRKTQRHSHEELRISYESHHYANYNKASHYNLNFLQEKNVYADPRLRFRVNSESDHNVFVDSLESWFLWEWLIQRFTLPVESGKCAILWRNGRKLTGKSTSEVAY